MKISAVIIAFNEAGDIAGAIESVKWCDEIVVVDSESTDDTRDIAEANGARVIVQPWLGFSDQKQFATHQARNDWVLSLDADERITPELRAEIETLFESGPAADGYSIPRLSVYMGREIRHSGWYPDRQLRLFDRRKGRWNRRIVHESFKLNDGAALGKLSNDILHYSVKSPEHHWQMITTRYAPLAARQAFQEGRRSNYLKGAIAGPAAFIRSFILKQGYRDGVPGFTIAGFAAQHARLKHILLRRMQTEEQGEE